MAKNQKRLGEILIEKGKISPDMLKAALEEQAMTKEFLGEILLKRHMISEKDLLITLSEQFDMPVVNLKDSYIDWDVVKGFSSSMILDYRCFPIKKDGSTVTVAITNPLDVWVLKKAEEETKGLRLNLMLTSQADMNEAIARYRQFMQESISRKFK